jgi:hypothetical protein
VDTFVQGHEAAVRLGAFVGIFSITAPWEVLAPRAARRCPAVRT